MGREGWVMGKHTRGKRHDVLHFQSPWECHVKRKPLDESQRCLSKGWTVRLHGTDLIAQEGVIPFPQLLQPFD